MDEVVLRYVFITLTMYLDDTTVEAGGSSEVVVTGIVIVAETVTVTVEK